MAKLPFLSSPRSPPEWLGPTVSPLPWDPPPHLPVGTTDLLLCLQANLQGRHKILGERGARGRGRGRTHQELLGRDFRDWDQFWSSLTALVSVPSSTQPLPLCTCADLINVWL